MRKESTPSACRAFVSAPETSARPPVLAKGTASDERMATRKGEPELWSLIFELWSLTSNPSPRSKESKCKELITKYSRLALHRREELGVRFRLLQTLEHDFHLLHGRERI